MAKRFQFRLEPFLKLRTHKVDEAKNALKIAANMRHSKEHEIDVQECYFRELLTSSSGSCKAVELQVSHFHKAHVSDEIKRLEKEKVKLLEVESQKRTHLTDKMKEEKVLQKLKEKQIAVNKDEIEKEEVKVLDEIARNSIDKVDILKAL